MPDKLPDLETTHRPGAFLPRTRHRLAYVWRSVWIGLIPLAIILVATAAVMATSSSGSDMTAMLVASAVNILVVGGAALYFWRKGYAVYQVNGLECEFLTRDYYIPPDVLASYIARHVIEPMAAHLPLAWETLDGNRVTFTDDIVLANGKRAWGATWPGVHSKSVVYAPYILHPGVTAWELKLQLCHVLFPGQSELEDIAWMESVGII